MTDKQIRDKTEYGHLTVDDIHQVASAHEISDVSNIVKAICLLARVVRGWD